MNADSLPQQPTDPADGKTPPRRAARRPYARLIGLIGGLLVFSVMIALPPPVDMPSEAWRVAGCAALMAIWWLSEAIPVAATALLPLALFPLLGIAAIEKTATPYANPLIFLFMGGFMIALAMQRWDLHRRIALTILKAAGTAPDRLIGGFMAATALLSMWVSNTATTVMMLPIAISVIAMVSREASASKARQKTDRFSIALLLGIAYAASIGGVATLIGTPPNALLAAFLAERHGIAIGFARWMLIGLPLALAGLTAAWFLLTKLLYKTDDDPVAGAGEAIDREYAALGRLSAPEKRVAIIFILVAAAWILRPTISAGIPNLSDAGIAIAGALAMFVIPAGMRDGRSLLDWERTKTLPWGVLLLFGGGLSLAAAINESGLAGWIGAAMHGFTTWPVLLVILAVTAVVIFLTELTSNTATAATFLPLAAALAVTVAVPVPYLAVPAALAASCAFMMPVATPPNAIVFGSGMLTVGQMARAGIWLNLVSTVLITGAVYFLLRFVFDT